jgi:RNA polymerase sigma-70 factor, ECF subfamily
MTPSSSNVDAEPSPPPSFCGDAERTKSPGDSTGRDFSSLPEQWLDLHGDALFRYALVMGADEHRAEDLVQETLLAALKGRERFDAAASERTWLIAILRNKAIDERRRDRRQGASLDDLDPAVEGNFTGLGKWRKAPSRWNPNPQLLLESREFWGIFRACMGALPVNIREAFVLRVLEGMSGPETCRILQISATNLWTTLFRARERLRRCLEGKWLKKEDR